MFSSRWSRRAVPSVLALAVVALAGLAGCDFGSASGKPQVVTGFYPLQYVAQRIAGDHVDVVDLTKPGGEPHDLDLPPQDIAKVTGADLVVYLKGFQPSVDDAVRQASGRTLDVASAANLVEADPHFWLDPRRYAKVADAVTAQLRKVDPEHAKAFTANAGALKRDLAALDSAYTKSLKSCASRYLVTSHAAFGYLALRYDLTQKGITGLTPEAEPNPRDMAETAKFVKANNVKTIYYETLVSDDVARAVARSTGAKVAVLDPIEGLTDKSAGDSYPEVMRSNLKTLRKGQGCR